MRLINVLAAGWHKSATLVSVVKRDKTKVDGGAEKPITQALSEKCHLAVCVCVYVCVCVRACVCVRRTDRIRAFHPLQLLITVSFSPILHNSPPCLYKSLLSPPLPLFPMVETAYVMAG